VLETWFQDFFQLRPDVADMPTSRLEKEEALFLNVRPFFFPLLFSFLYPFFFPRVNFTESPDVILSPRKIPTYLQAKPTTARTRV
jgi:hypothetical protein